MRIVAVTNQKGGVGKTTTALSVGACLAGKKQKVLLIDFDGSCNLTLACGGESEGVCTAYEMMTLECTAEDAIQSMPGGYDLIGANANLPGAEGTIADPVSRIVRLKNCLEPIKDKYDWIIIDTPPNLGFLTANALVAATDVLIPSEADFLSAKGVVDLVNGTIRSIKSNINPNLHVLGIVLTKYVSNTNNSKAMTMAISEMASQFNIKVFDTTIRNNVAVKDAQARKLDLLHYSKSAYAALDYNFLTCEIMKEVKKNG